MSGIEHALCFGHGFDVVAELSASYQNRIDAEVYGSSGLCLVFRRQCINDELAGEGSFRVVPCQTDIESEKLGAADTYLLVEKKRQVDFCRQA